MHLSIHIKANFFKKNIALDVSVCSVRGLRVFKKHSAVAQRNNSGNRRRYHGAIILLMEPTCGRI